MKKSLTNVLQLFVLAIFVSAFLVSCGGEGKDYVESTVEDPTQGIQEDLRSEELHLVV